MPEGQELKPGTTQISPDILSSLGLTAEDIALHDKERKQEEETLVKARGWGKTSYEQFRKQAQYENFVVRPQVIIPGLPNFNLDGSIKIENMPDALAAKHGEYWYFKVDPNAPEEGKAEAKTQMERDKKRISSFLEGYGEAALEKNDWITAVNAFDVATGNVAGNEKLMEKLKEVASKNKESGVEIAKTMQERVNKREATQIPTYQPPSTA